MKQLYNILSLLCVFFLFACSAEEDMAVDGGTGYLRLSVNGSNETTTKAANLPEGYNGKQIAVEIVDEENSVVKKTDDWTQWQGEQIPLKAGNYIIKAHSYGFDGKQSAMAAPYYYGSKAVTVTSGKEVNETITCKLANVKMSVKISDKMREAFKTFSVSVKPKKTGDFAPLTFNIDLKQTSIADTAYFPVTDVVVSYSATNQSDKQNSAEKELTGVKGNDHYILNFALAESGKGNVTVEVDETMHTYTYTFTLSQHPTNGATITANAWSRFAMVEALASTGTGVTLDPEKMKFEYQLASASEKDPWQSVAATQDVSDPLKFRAKISSLTPETEYRCHLTDGEGFESAVSTFTTETEEELPNGNFEDWCVRKAGTAMLEQNTTFPCADEDYDNNRFWDTSNRGANSLGQKDPTNKTEELVQAGKYAAKLSSIEVFGKMAAASLYVGDFKGASMSGTADIDFGRSFTSRPIALHGYYKYTPVKISKGGSGLPEGAPNVGDPDQCAIYIALAKKSYAVNNGDQSSFIKFKDDPNIIAYGELPSGAATSGDGYTEFTIPLKYKAEQLGEKPTHIIVVCSASKYGDYMMGGVGSTLLVDDFSLIYEGEPTIWE